VQGDLPPRVIVVLDADYSDHPDLLPKLSEPILNGKASAHLDSIDTKDLHQEVIIPSADSSFHSEAVLAGMLFEQRQREAPNPC